MCVLSCTACESCTRRVITILVTVIEIHIIHTVKHGHALYIAVFDLCKMISSWLRIPPKQAFTIEEKLVVGPTARGEFQEVCWSCKGMLCNFDEHGCSQAPHQEVVVLEIMETILDPLPFSIFVCMTGHILQECCQRHVKDSIDLAGVGRESFSGHQSSNDRSDLQLQTTDVRQIAWESQVM